MRSKNSRAFTVAESAHLEAVKSVSCVLCDAPPPSIAHHVVQGNHFTTIALCEPCHVGKQGVHGDQTMLRIAYGLTRLDGEVRAINDTLKRVAEFRQ